MPPQSSGIAFAGDQVFDRGDVAAIVGHADLDIAEREPEFVHVARQRDRDDDAVGLIDRFLDEGDDVAVIDRNEAQIAGLLQRRVLPADAVEIADVGLDIARLVPVPHLDLVLFRIEIFFAPRNRFVFQELEAVVDAVAARQRRGQRDAGFEHPGLAALQVIGQDVGRIDEEIRPIEIAFRIGRQLAQILLQLRLLGPPGEAGGGLREAELGEALHQFRPRQRSGEEDRVGMAKLNVVDQPFPESEAVWCGGCRPGKS